MLKINSIKEVKNWILDYKIYKRTYKYAIIAKGFDWRKEEKFKITLEQYKECKTNGCR